MGEQGTVEKNMWGIKDGTPPIKKLWIKYEGFDTEFDDTVIHFLGQQGFELIRGGYDYTKNIRDMEFK